MLVQKSWNITLTWVHPSLTSLTKISSTHCKVETVYFDEGNAMAAFLFVANLAVWQQNKNNLAFEFPLTAKAVQDSFYVDDSLIGSDTGDEGITLRKDLQEIFCRGRLLRKWNSNSQEVLDRIPPNYREQVLNVAHHLMDIR